MIRIDLLYHGYTVPVPVPTYVTEQLTVQKKRNKKDIMGIMTI